MKTKSFFLGVFALSFLNIAVVQAQTVRPGRVQPKSRQAAAVGEGTKDGLMMQKGRVVLTELGISNPLTADKKLINGTTISPAGVVTGTNGTTTQMSEGDIVSLTGRVTTRSAIAESDSLAKIKLFDALHPGKRKKMEAEAERKAKVKAKLAEEKAKRAAKKK